MQSLWLENNQLSLRDEPQPAKPNEAVIRIRKAGICGTDLELVKGYYPFTGIPGHEFVGEVIESPDPAWVGKRVVGEINLVCGSCEQCRSGRSTHCENRTVLGIVNRDGVFAEFTALPLENLHVVPDEVSDEAAVFTEPLAAALEIQQQVQIHPTDRVLLIGAGRLGQLIAQTLVLTGSDLKVVARHPLQKNLLAGRGIRLIEAEDVQRWRYDLVVERRVSFRIRFGT
jgi:threonine dehydrogenase-like Zn-dependent dehydrogenase